jgi:hypothetical protein
LQRIVTCTNLGKCQPPGTSHVLADPLATETSPAPYLHTPSADLLPVPLPGQHPRDGPERARPRHEETERLIAGATLFVSAEPPNRNEEFVMIGQLFIGGKFRAAAKVIPVVEAATGEKLADGPSATEADIDDAVAAAHSVGRTRGGQPNRPSARQC